MEPNDPQSESITSNYYTENQFIRYFSPRLKEFSLAHFNIRSANRNFDNLKLLLANLNYSPSVIGLTETWFSDIPNPMHYLPNYEVVTNNRVDRVGGGVALYIDKKYNFSIIQNLTVLNNTMETLFIEIDIAKNKNIVIGVIYRPPQSNPRDFITHIQEMLSFLTQNENPCFILGDFNINLLNSHSNPIPQEFLEALLSNSFAPLIVKPTRLTGLSATLIDNIFTNVQPLPESGILLSDLTDHFPVFCHMNIKNEHHTPSPREKVRIINDDNLSLFKESLSNADWTEVFDSSNTDDAFNAFMSTTLFHFNTHIPLRDKNRCNYKKVPRAPWLTRSLLKSINRKNNLFYKSKVDPSVKKKYETYRNKLTSIIRMEKKNYFTNKFNDHKNDIKQTWKIINNVLNKSSVKAQISQIEHNGTLISEPNVLSETFNTYFANIGETLAKNIPPVNKSFFDYLENPVANTIFFTPVTVYELCNIINDLPNKKSHGHDGVDNCVLKQIVLQIAEPLVHIFNLSLTSGVVPGKMKTAKVVPIFKKGNKLNLSNYRPISLLTSLSKILEKIIYKRTVTFLKDNKVFCNFQFGFREKHSTSHAILTLINTITSAIDKSLHTIGIFLDFSKAFDTIDHTILLHKLSHYGIRGKALEWFRNYLSNRNQYVSLNGHNSPIMPINCGVPQGSLLGPLLFIIYINDFHKSSSILSFILFADDSNLFYSHRDPATLLSTINSELNRVTDWIKANKLSLNLKKTYYMLFSNTLTTLPANILFDKVPIEKVKNTKFLGIIIDDKLSWKSHTDNLSKLISRNIGVLNKLKYMFPSSVLLSLYFTLCFPYLNYGILAWGNSTCQQLNRLLLLQKKAMRVVCNTGYLSHTDQLFLDKKVLKVSDLYLFNLGQFMFKLINNELPNVFTDLFISNNALHNYPTRQSNFFHLPLTRTLLAHKTFVFTGPKFWNSLDPSLKDIERLHRFKREIKSLLLKQYQTNQNPFPTLLHAR